MKRKNPDTTTLLLLAAGAGAAYYFLIHKKKEEKKKEEAAASLITAVATPKVAEVPKEYKGFGTLTSGRAAGFAIPTLSGGSLGSRGAGSLS